MIVGVEADEKVSVLAEACAALAAGDSSAAESIIQERYPFEPRVKSRVRLRGWG